MSTELPLKDEQREQFFEMESTPGEGAVTTAEMTAKHVDYHTHLAEKAVRSFESTDSSFERRSTVS